MAMQREKLPYGGGYYHLMNRINGKKHSYPFEKTDKEFAVNLLKKLSAYYYLEIISYCIMGNHFHIVLYNPPNTDIPDDRTIIERHNTYYADEPHNQIEPDDNEAIAHIRNKMNDISFFMQAFEQKFTLFYNDKHDRRGPLWCGRYTSAILEGATALWPVVEYLELNPVRAGLCKDPGDYRFSSWGEAKGTGRHSFSANFTKHLKLNMGDFFIDISDADLFSEFSGQISEIAASERGLKGKALQDKVDKARAGDNWGIRLLRRIKHFTDGGIIGSENFIRKTAACFYDKKRVSRKKLSKCGKENAHSLFSFRIVRLI